MTWRWIVAPGVEPAADALEELQAARALVPDAVLVASKVVLPDGSLDPGSEPLARILDKVEAIDTARLGLLAVRAVRPGSLLVRSDVPGGHAVVEADCPAAMLSASARLLSGRRGVLAPQSIAQRSVRGPVESVADRLRLLAAPAWTREERLMQAFALAGGGRRRAARAGR